MTSAATSASALLAERFREAALLHARGQLAQAQAVCQSILGAQPRHFEALHLSGVIALQSGDPRLASQCIGRAVEVFPEDASAHCNHGLALQALRQFEAALASFERAASIQPDFAEAHFNRGNVLKALGQPQAALASYERALALKPTDASIHFNRGAVLQSLEEWQAALASYDRAVAFGPDFFQAHSNRGVALGELEEWEAALAAHERALAIAPQRAELHFRRADALRKLRCFDAAVAGYDRALAIKPDYAEAYCNRGIALKHLGRLQEALASHERAIQLRPDFDFAAPHVDLGNVLMELGRPQEALARYERAVALQENFAEARLGRSGALLLLGDFARGWADYEWRWRTRANRGARREFPQPPWRGREGLSGKTILLYPEQGFGDILQFARYVPCVAQLQARVILEAPQPLLRLLGGLRGVSELIEFGKPLPDFDCHCPLLSLPLAFGTTLETIPPTTGLLRPDPTRIARWQTRLAGTPGVRVGLAWSGNPMHANDRHRSIPLAQLLEHLPGGPCYVSLQKDLRPADRRVLDSNPQILSFAEELRDFADTAALCECLDLMISVDTSVAHLSAALGRRTWILLAFNPDWRWLRHRDDSPWYPSVTLYRQRRLADWGEVLTRVGSDLSRLVAADPTAAGTAVVGAAR